MSSPKGEIDRSLERTKTEVRARARSHVKCRSGVCLHMPDTKHLRGAQTVNAAEGENPSPSAEASSQRVGAAPATKRGLVAVLLSALVMYQADATIVNVATPSIHAALRASGAELELVVGGYLLASATLFITGARLGAMWGYRRVFLSGLAVFGLSSLLCGLAPTAPVLIGARVLQGTGGALMIPQVLSMIQLSFTGRQRTRVLGLYAIALSCGAVVGQILGGALVSANLFAAQWRPTFLINVPIAVSAFVAGLRCLPVNPRTGDSPQLDLAGASALSGGVVLILLPLTLGREQHWPAWCWICVATSPVLVALFIAIEHRAGARGRSALINLSVVARPAIAWGLCSQALAVSTYYALLFTLAQFLQQGRGQSALVSGLTLVPWVAAFGLPGRLLGRVSQPLRSKVAPAGAFVLASSYLGLSATMLAGIGAESVLCVLLCVGGFGLGMIFSSILEHLTIAATPRFAADISGVFTTSLQVAGTIGVAAFGTAYLGLASHPGPATPMEAFGIIAAAFALVALAASAMAHRATAVSRSDSKPQMPERSLAPGSEATATDG